MRCIKCGAEISDNEKFCSVCGTPVDDKLKVVDNVTLSDYAVDKSDGSEKKQNSNKKSTKVDKSALTDTTDVQGDMTVSDITVGNFIMPDDTISDDTIIGNSPKNKFSAKEPDKVSDAKNRKKEKEFKEKTSKNIEIVKEYKEYKEKKNEESTEPVKFDSDEKAISTEFDKFGNEFAKKSEIKGITANKKETETKVVKVKYTKIDDAENDEDNEVVYDNTNENINADADESNVIKIDKDARDIKLMVTKTTTISEEYVKSDGDKTEYEIKQEPAKEKHISVAGKNLTFVQSNQVSLAREDKHLSPGAKANIERRKAEAVEALKKEKSDEERINDAVKAIKESVIRNGKEGWICRVCGHYNPSTVTSCLKCGRDRVRMAKLDARGYDPNAVPQLVKHKRRMRPKKERIVYLPPDKKEEVQTNNAPVTSNTPIVHNYIYTGAYPGAYSGVYKNTQQVSYAKDPYVLVEHPVRNRIVALICTILMVLFIFVSLFATSYISTDGSIVEGFIGIEIISSVIAGLLGGFENGSKYFEMFRNEITTNGWIIEDTGLLNQRALACVLVMLVLSVAVVLAVIDIIRCIIREVKGKPMNGRFHILSFIILMFACAMFLFIWMHNEFAFYQGGPAAFWGHQSTVTVTLDGATITSDVYSTGIAYIVTFFLILLRFIMGFFFAKPERMRLSEASERYPWIYPQKYYKEHTDISPEDYAIIMRNSGAMSQTVPPMQNDVMVRQETTTQTVSNFERPVTFAPPPPSHMDVKPQAFTTYAVPDNSMVSDYTVTTNIFPSDNTETD